MKAAYRMTHWERREWLEKQLSEAKSMAKMYQEMSDYSRKSDPHSSEQYQSLSDDWQREVERLKLIKI